MSAQQQTYAEAVDAEAADILGNALRFRHGFAWWVKEIHGRSDAAADAVRSCRVQNSRFAGSELADRVAHSVAVAILGPESDWEKRRNVSNGKDWSDAIDEETERVLTDRDLLATATLSWMAASPGGAQRVSGLISRAMTHAIDADPNLAVELLDGIARNLACSTVGQLSDWKGGGS